MEIQKNVAIISIAEYDELRNIRKALDEGNAYVTFTGFGGIGIYTKDELIKKMSEANHRSSDREAELRNTIDSKNMELYRLERTVADLKHSSIWEFLAWRRKQKNKK